MRCFEEMYLVPASEIDISDDEGIYNGNWAPPEYYQQNMKIMNVNYFKRKHYLAGTLKLIKNVDNF